MGGWMRYWKRLSSHWREMVSSTLLLLNYCIAFKSATVLLEANLRYSNVLASLLLYVMGGWMKHWKRLSSHWREIWLKFWTQVVSTCY